jgi:hypothetical protein
MQFSNVSYSGTVSGSGSGSDDFGDTGIATITATVIADLTENANGSISGTFSYANGTSELTATAGPSSGHSEAGPDFAGGGTVSGTQSGSQAGTLMFSGANGDVIASGTATINGNDTTITITSGSWSFNGGGLSGGGGIGSSSLSGSPSSPPPPPLSPPPPPTISGPGALLNYVTTNVEAQIANWASDTTEAAIKVAELSSKGITKFLNAYPTIAGSSVVADLPSDLRNLLLFGDTAANEPYTAITWNQASEALGSIFRSLEVFLNTYNLASTVVNDGVFSTNAEQQLIHVDAALASGLTGELITATGAAAGLTTFVTGIIGAGAVATTVSGAILEGTHTRRRGIGLGFELLCE